jgi:hypothetical protein
MPLKFNVVSNINNGYGLEDDYQIVKALLESYGHSVVPVQYDRAQDIQPADINIFLETIIPVFGYAKENWYIPNPEWFDPKVEDEYLPRFKYVLCKTKDSLKLFHPRSRSAVLLGFDNQDYHMPGIKRQFSFLHVAGQSVIKNTEAVIDAWNDFNIPYHLDLIATKYLFFSRVKSDKITVYRDRIHEGMYVTLLNKNRFHVCPSKYEGWGHSIHDARSVGAVIITTDAPPMNEFNIPQDCLVPAVIEGRMRLANLNLVSAKDLAETVLRVAAFGQAMIWDIGDSNRENFLEDRDLFRYRFRQIVNDAEGRLCAN